MIDLKKWGIGAVLVLAACAGAYLWHGKEEAGIILVLGALIGALELMKMRKGR